MSDSPPELPPAEGCYDPELPFLQALELEIARSAARAARPPHERPPATPRPGLPVARARRGPHVRTTTRVARRSLTLVALLCLLGASAFGAREAFSGAGVNPAATHRGALTLVVRGGVGAESWSLRAYRLGGELCRVLVAGGNEDSRCAPAPAPGALAVTSLLGPRRRYLFGVAGRRIAQVAVRAGGVAQTVPTRALSAPLARSAGLPPGARYFVAVLVRPDGASDPPALVRGRDSRLRSVGAPLAVCVESAEPPRCSG